MIIWILSIATENIKDRESVHSHSTIKEKITRHKEGNRKCIYTT